MTAVTGAARYKKGETLGEGTFGVVFKALDTVTGRTVAVKKIRLSQYKEGVNVTALREIKLLKELHDPNIIELIDVYPHKFNLYLVFEFMESDLEMMIKDISTVLSPADVKSYMQMATRAIAFCHANWVLHRDLKPNNFLVASDGHLKLADFGLGRIFGSPDRRLTHQVFARWYRAPELLFGARHYGPSVDMWALGCIFAELLQRRPFLVGETDIEQLGKVFAALGTPTEAEWPGVSSLPDYIEFKADAATPLATLFPKASEDAIDLLGRMLTFDPAARITAEQALGHRYFKVHPLPTPPERLPRPPTRPSKANRDAAPVTSPVVLSPGSGKMRRLSFPPPDLDPSSAPAQSSEEELRKLGESADGLKPAEVVAAAVGVPMSVDGEAAAVAAGPGRPTLSSVDRIYLRKRKLDMDIALQEQAS